MSFAPSDPSPDRAGPSFSPTRRCTGGRRGPASFFLAAKSGCECAAQRHNPFSLPFTVRPPSVAGAIINTRFRKPVTGPHDGVRSTLPKNGDVPRSRASHLQSQPTGPHSRRLMSDWSAATYGKRRGRRDRAEHTAGRRYISRTVFGVQRPARRLVPLSGGIAIAEG